MSDINSDKQYIPIERSMIERQFPHAIDGDNYEIVHGLLNAALLHRVNSLVVLNKFIELAHFFSLSGRHRDSVELLLQAIDLFPKSNDVFNSLGENLASYVAQNKSEFCDEDIRWIGTAVEFLYSINDGPLGARHQLDRNPGMQKINRAVNALRLKNDVVAESPHTHFLSSISLKQFQNLTPDERRKKAADIFARKLLELEKAKRGKGGRSDA